MDVAQDSLRPKYEKVLEQLARVVEAQPAGTRLPSVRQLMADYSVSQAAIERCLDELVRRGQVRRERSRGLFVDGVQPKNNVIGVYTDSEVTPHSNALFVEGVRSAATRQGFRAADFGAHDRFTHHAELKDALQQGMFSGIIAALSTGGLMDIEEDEKLTGMLRENRVPLVTCLPVPAVRADTVTPDYFTAFEKVGRFLRERTRGPVLFLGHQGMINLARMHGLRAGLGADSECLSEMIDVHHGGVFARLHELKAKGWPGSVVLAVPPVQPGEAAELQDLPWRAGTGHELFVTLEETQRLPVGVAAHAVVKPTVKMGEAAASLLIRRLRGFRGEMCQEIVRHEIKFALE